nr:ABC transporter substrate-binding protein [Raoultella sp. NCTC 9187]
MKKTLIAAGLLALFSFSAAASETLTVGATPVPHAEILEFVKTGAGERRGRFKN